MGGRGPDCLPDWALSVCIYIHMHTHKITNRPPQEGIIEGLSAADSKMLMVRAFLGLSVIPGRLVCMHRKDPAPSDSTQHKTKQKIGERIVKSRQQLEHVYADICRVRERKGKGHITQTTHRRGA